MKTTNPVSDHIKPWLLFLEVKKNKQANWYGTNAVIRKPSGFSMIIARSYDAKNKWHARILILREALLRIKEGESRIVACFDKRNIWNNLMNDKVTIHWEIYHMLFMTLFY